MNIAQALALRGEPESYERQENAWLLEHITKIDAFDLVMKKDQELTAAQEQQYTASLARIAAGEPLAYVTGSQPFWTLDLKVTKDTLVPRPDTEVLVETVLHLDVPEDARIVDLGTGTGAVALSIASERPDCDVTAVDVMPDAVALAQRNVEHLGFRNVTVLQSSWFAALENRSFAMIVSNPPYIDEYDPHLAQGDVRFEPLSALVAANAGLADLEHIVTMSRKHLLPGGWLLVEHGWTQGEAVRALFTQAGYAAVETCRDYGGNERLTLGQWL